VRIKPGWIALRRTPRCASSLGGGLAQADDARDDHHPCGVATEGAGRTTCRSFRAPVNGAGCAVRR
jgi:hypothetical protein